MTVTSQPRDGARLASKEERAARAKKGKKDDRPEQFYITHGLRNEPPGSERLTQNGLFEGKDPFFSFKETSMTSIAASSIQIQTSSESAPCAPSWFGEVVLMASHLKKQGVLTKLCEQVRFARKRFGRYEGAT